MTRVSRLLDRIRQTLADPGKTRWSDAKLLSLLSEAQQDMSIRCLLLKKEVTYNLVNGRDTYRLPKDFIKLETAWASDGTSPDKFLSIVHYKDMGTLPRRSVGVLPTHVIVGFTDRDLVKIWPTPEETLKEDIIPQNDLFGVLVSSKKVKCNREEGVVSNIDSPTVVQNSPYGIVTSIKRVLGQVTILYYYKPEYLASLEDELAIMDTCDKGLMHYVTGMALRDDMDTRNRAAAMEELQLYEIEVKRNAVDRAGSFTHDSKLLDSTKFRTGFER